nr:pectinesterase-like [Ipomoea batatas]
MDFWKPASFLLCRRLWYTFYVHAHGQFYCDCAITAGTTDFILGNMAAAFQSCKLIIGKPSSLGCWLLRSTNEVRTADADLRRSDQLRCRVPTPTSTSIAPPPDHCDQPDPPPRLAGCRPPRSTDHCDTAPPLTTVFWTSGSVATPMPLTVPERRSNGLVEHEGAKMVDRGGQGGDEIIRCCIIIPATGYCIGTHNRGVNAPSATALALSRNLSPPFAWIREINR